ncbi:MAG: glycosyltransferase family 4 protein [Methanomassiliicoccales archaeon]|nr:glycosyltransferase family 4 protein [Methanomassiliicoccales archaeon]
MPRKVLMLLSNEFRPDPRVHKEALGLMSAGYEVTILAWNRDRTFPEKDAQKGIEVRRISTRPITGTMSLIINYPSFLLRSIFRSRGLSFDVVHSNDLDTLLIGVLISRLRGVPLVYDAHEHYAKMVETDLPKSISPIIDRIEAMLVKRASLVVAANEPIADYLRPNTRSDIIVVMNCIDVPIMHHRIRDAAQNEFVLFYGGTLEPMRYIEETILAIENTDNCRLRIAGLGRLKEMVQKSAQQSEKVEYLGFLPHDKLLSEMAESDAVLCLLDPSNENYRIATPNRLCEAMALGVPVIASNATLTGEIVEDTGCGISMDWSEENLAEAVRRLRDPALHAKLGENGIRAARSQYNWSEMKAKLLKSYDLLLSKRKFQNK